MRKGVKLLPVTVAEALEMEVFQKCRLLTGESGLQNIILWVNILEILDDLSHIEPGELLITTAHDFNNQSPGNQEGMIELFAAKKLAAVAIQTGHYVQKLPDSFIALAENHSIPIIEIPSDISFKSITKALMNKLVQDAYSEATGTEEKSPGDKLERQAKTMKNLWLQLLNTNNPQDYHLELARFNLEAKEPIVVAIISFSNIKNKTPAGSVEDHLKIIRQADIILIRLLQELHVPFLLGPSERSSTILLQSSQLAGDSMALNLEVIQGVIDNFKTAFPDYSIQAGLSCLHNDITGIKPALGEAKKALHAAELKLVEAEEVLPYKNLGLYRLIMDIKNFETLMCYFNETTAPLLEYDQNSEGALLKTLRQYMKSCSIKKASEKLYVHRHTMKYRLEQVHKLTGLDPLQPDDALQLNIGLFIYRYLQALKMIS